jgi:hypothetical protein
MPYGGEMEWDYAAMKLANYQRQMEVRTRRLRSSDY